jgi:hypothetical protein
MGIMNHWHFMIRSLKTALMGYGTKRLLLL